MWTTLIAAIAKEDRDNELARFLSRIRAGGIRTIAIEPEQMDSYSYVKQESLILTDQKNAARSAVRAGTALLALEREGREPIDGAPYLATGLEGLDKNYLLTVYKRFHGEPLTIARTKRLWIRELTCKEEESFLSLCRQAGASMEKGFLPAYRKYQYGFYGYGFWSLLDRRSGEWLGTAGVEDRTGEDGSYLELGYAVVPERRRQGLISEACLAIFRYLKEELGFSGTVKCFVPKENTASRKTAQSIGMSRISRTLQTKEKFDKFYCYERIL